MFLIFFHLPRGEVIFQSKISDTKEIAEVSLTFYLAVIPVKVEV